jgi:hypothetical protein
MSVQDNQNMEWHKLINKYININDRFIGDTDDHGCGLFAVVTISSSCTKQPSKYAFFTRLAIKQ